MSTDRQPPDHERDPHRPDPPVYEEGTPVEERDTSSPAARQSRGVSAGSVRILIFVVVAIVAVYIVVLLTGALDLGGDAPQADEIIQESPQVETPAVPGG